MLDDLLSAIAGREDPDQVGLRIDGLQWVGADVELGIALSEEEVVFERWRVLCQSVREVRLHDREGDVEFLDESHPAVRTFLDPWREVTFYGLAPDPDALVGRLFVAHKAVVGPWVAFDDFLNPEIELRELVAGGFGRLAEGPAFLVEALGAVLEGAGIRIALGPPRTPKYWNGSSWQPVEGPLAGIAIGASLIVAARFEHARVAV